VEKSLGLSGESCGVVLVALFETQTDWENYMHDERHLSFGGKLKGIIDLDHMILTQTKLNCTDGDAQ
jgi:hypothetical protein